MRTFDHSIFTLVSFFLFQILLKYLNLFFSLWQNNRCIWKLKRNIQSLDNHFMRSVPSITFFWDYIDSANRICFIPDSAYTFTHARTTTLQSLQTCFGFRKTFFQESNAPWFEHLHGVYSFGTPRRIPFCGTIPHQAARMEKLLNWSE